VGVLVGGRVAGVAVGASVAGGLAVGLGANDVGVGEVSLAISGGLSLPMKSSSAHKKIASAIKNIDRTITPVLF
jgi:hypothetical protein